MAATFVWFEVASEDIAKKQHDFNADQLNIILTNTAPNAATNTVKANITQIAATFGYTTDGIDTANSTSRAGAITSVNGTDCIWSAVGGNIGPFTHAVLVSITNNKLIGYWSVGSTTILDGKSWKADIGTSLFTLGG